MKLKSMALALPAVALLISCSAHVNLPDNPTIQGGAIPDYATSRMAGKINGQTWSLGQGNATLSDGDNGQKNLLLTFGQTAAGDPCAPVDASGANGAVVMATVPDRTGETQFSFLAGNSIGLAYADSQGTAVKAANGKIRISAVSDTQVSGQLVADFDDNNLVNGTFTIPICNSDHAAAAPTVPESN